MRFYLLLDFYWYTFLKSWRWPKGRNITDCKLQQACRGNTVNVLRGYRRQAWSTWGQEYNLSLTLLLNKNLRAAMRDRQARNRWERTSISGPCLVRQSVHDEEYEGEDGVDPLIPPKSKVIPTRLSPYTSRNLSGLPSRMDCRPTRPKLKTAWQMRKYPDIKRNDNNRGDHVEEDNNFHRHDSEVMVAIQQSIPRKERFNFPPLSKERPCQSSWIRWDLLWLGAIWGPRTYEYNTPSKPHIIVMAAQRWLK